MKKITSKKDYLDYYCDGYYMGFRTIENRAKAIKATETYGTSCFVIDDQDIEDLKSGKLLVQDDGEYTTIIRYRETFGREEDLEDLKPNSSEDIIKDMLHRKVEREQKEGIPFDSLLDKGEISEKDK